MLLHLYLLVSLWASHGVHPAGANPEPSGANACGNGGGYCSTDDKILLQHAVQRTKVMSDAQAKTEVSEGMGEPLMLHEGPQGRTRVFIGIKTGASSEYRTRRDRLRSMGCGQAYTAAGFRWSFFLGVPLDQGHSLTEHWQGVHATEHEQKEEVALLNESYTNKDMQFLMFRDQYMDLPNKLLGLLQFGYRHAQADYVMEIDDDQCANATRILEIISEHEARRNGNELWAGFYYFRGTENPSMQGADGTYVGFFSGHGSFVSRGLLRYVVGEDLAHSIMHGFYGTSSDDADLGRWVQYAAERHGVRVDIKTAPDIVTPIQCERNC